MPPKVQALIGGLTAMSNAEPDGPERKAVVFSQFTKFLDVIQRHLEENGWPCCRVDGTMTAETRKRQLAAWRPANSTGAPAVLLVSTLAGKGNRWMRRSVECACACACACARGVRVRVRVCLFVCLVF